MLIDSAQVFKPPPLLCLMCCASQLPYTELERIRHPKKHLYTPASCLQLALLTRGDTCAKMLWCEARHAPMISTSDLLRAMRLVQTYVLMGAQLREVCRGASPAPMWAILGLWSSARPLIVQHCRWAPPPCTRKPKNSKINYMRVWLLDRYGFC